MIEVVSSVISYSGNFISVINLFDPTRSGLTFEPNYGTVENIIVDGPNTSVFVKGSGQRPTILTVDGVEHPIPQTFLSDTVISCTDDGWNVSFEDTEHGIYQARTNLSESVVLTPNITYSRLRTAFPGETATEFIALDSNRTDGKPVAIPVLPIQLNPIYKIQDLTLSLVLDAPPPFISLEYSITINNVEHRMDAYNLYIFPVSLSDKDVRIEYNLPPNTSYVQVNNPITVITNYVFESPIIAYNSSLNTTGGNAFFNFPTDLPTDFWFEYDGVRHENVIGPVGVQTTSLGAVAFEFTYGTDNTIERYVGIFDVLDVPVIVAQTPTINRNVQLTVPPLPSFLSSAGFCLFDGTSQPASFEYPAVPSQTYHWISTFGVISPPALFTSPAPTASISASYSSGVVKFTVDRDENISTLVNPSITLNEQTTTNNILNMNLQDGTYDYTVEWPSNFWPTISNVSELVVQTINTPAVAVKTVTTVVNTSVAVATILGLIVLSVV